MPRGPRSLVDGGCYHVTSRGNQQQQTFYAPEDYRRMGESVYYYKGKFGLKIYAYCFMPNHVHFVVQPAQGKMLSKFMHGLLRSYTEFFNEKYQKVGHLWQGRFASRIIDTEHYFSECLAYVENNPVRANIVSSAIEYPWSSCQERQLSTRNNKTIIDRFTL